jgi:hypothetical protein
MKTILIINILLTLMNRPYPNNDKMFPEISVLMCKNSHEVIRVITNHYKKFFFFFLVRNKILLLLLLSV